MDHNRSIFHERWRKYQVHLPPNYDSKNKYPVVLALHGGGGNAASFRIQTKLDSVADLFNFIVVYPEGTAAIGNSLTWNSGNCCGYAQNNNVDDVGFIEKLLDTLPFLYGVDKSRIYATGFSNGAAMCYRLACEIPERLAAIAPVSCTIGVDKLPNRPVPLFHIHGMKDNNAPYGGGYGTNSISHVNHTPVVKTMKLWREVNGLENKTTNVYTNPIYKMEAYASNPLYPEVLYSLFEGGHTWPGGVDITEGMGTGKLVKEFDASTIIWLHFKDYKLGS